MENSGNRCPRCGSTEIVTDPDLGEEICGSCGLVISEVIVDRGPEWRAFTASERDERPRTGLAESYALYDKGLTTSFGGLRDAHGRRLDLQTLERMSQLKRHDTRSKMDESWTRNLSIAMSELDRLSAVLHIPQSVKEHAALIYRKALQKDLIRGRSIDAFVAASLYAACRLNQVPRTLRRIVQASTRDHSEIARSYRLLIRELKLRMPIDDPIKFVPNIASKLNLKPETEIRAVEILKEARKRQGLAGKDPRGLAAAAIYLACVEMKEKRVQKEVAAAAGTTEVTLRNRLRGLETVLRGPPPGREMPSTPPVVGEEESRISFPSQPAP